MTKLTSTTCDNCETVIGSTNYSSEYYLTLSNSAKPYAGGAVYAMAINPPIDSEKHFCNLNCLKLWIEK